MQMDTGCCYHQHMEDLVGVELEGGKKEKN